MEVKAGEVWDITHSRKGSFTARFLQPVDSDTQWVDIEIAEGRAKFLSMENWIAGAGDTGNTITSRVSFLTLNQRRPEMEAP